MLKYEGRLRSLSRGLRRNLTDTGQVLWSRLRRKQILGVQFYRQRPIGPYVVDFYAPRAKLVIEADGPQHRNAEGLTKDQVRDSYLAGCGLLVLRFDDRQVLLEIEAVMTEIHRAVASRLEIPPRCTRPPFPKGAEE